MLRAHFSSAKFQPKLQIILFDSRVIKTHTSYNKLN